MLSHGIIWLIVLAVASCLVAIVAIILSTLRSITTSESSIIVGPERKLLPNANTIISNMVPGGSAEGWKISLSADGDTIAVGLPFYNSNHGAVAVYAKTGKTWNTQPQAILSSPLMTANLLEGSHGLALSRDGNKLAVGIPIADTAGPNTGETRIYVRHPTTLVWTLETVLTKSALGSYEGFSVAFNADADTLAVGAPGLNRVLLYTKYSNSDTWSIIPKQFDAPFVGGDFGASVALSLSGKTLLIGAPSSFSTAGSVIVFRLAGSIWTLNATLSQNIIGALEGTSIALSGDGFTLAVGAVILNSNSGGVFIYRNINIAWIYEGTLSQGVFGEKAGAEVALSEDGNLLATSCIGFSIVGSGLVGRVLVYKRTGSSWVLQETYVIRPYVSYAYNLSVAMNSKNTDTLAIGQPFYDTNNGRVLFYAIK